MSDIEHLDVLVIGAGLSGIGAAHYLQTETPWATYAIFEARDAIGGTWDLFRYPGIRSDSDMFTLGYSFRPWRDKKIIADGPSILQYIKDTAAAEGIDRHIRFSHRVTRAEWSTGEARWLVTAERADTGETVELTAGFLFSCTGYYRYDQGYLPEFAGIDEFEGQVVHPQHWPEDLDYAGKRVVVIGSGATAITLVPAMAADAGQVTMLQRSPTYVAALPNRDPLGPIFRVLLPGRRGDDVNRWLRAVGTQFSYFASQKYPALVKRLLLAGVKRQLPKGYDVATHFTPRYGPWDQRLCVAPDGDLFAAIREGRASVVTDTIDTFTPTGIRVASGQHLEADIVVTATGLDLLFLGGIELIVDGEKIDISQRLAYKGMMLEGVPNLALAIGYTNASWTLKCDLTCDYVARLLNELRAKGLRQATPRNHDASISAEPLLGLASGYVERAVDRMPKQGSRVPWQVHQSYIKDYRALKLGAIEDGAMTLSNPVSATKERVA